MAFDGSSRGVFQSGQQFMLKMRPHALKIYQEIFPGCTVQDLRNEGAKEEDGSGVHILDQHFGIDSLIVLPDGSFIPLQEKYRRHSELKWGDFTQEHKNAYGTTFEAPGEWFHLGAQLYFYGWANEDETDFAEYIFLDILRYKLLVQFAGGLDKIGQFRTNKSHGRASFYAICLSKLSPAILSRKLSPAHLGRINTDMAYKGIPKEKRQAILKQLNYRNRWSDNQSDGLKEVNAEDIKW